MVRDPGSVAVGRLSKHASAGPVRTAPNAGGDLRAARERLGWPLQDASTTLRIRRAYLEALEEGDLEKLPGNAFALGFLRCYTSALGLDPEEMLRRFKAEAAAVSQRTELSFPAPVPEHGLPTGAVILLGVVLAVGAYIGWYRLSGEGRLPAEAALTIPERLSPLAEQALPPTVLAPNRGDAAAATVGVGPSIAVLSPTAAAAAPVAPVEAVAAPAVPVVAAVAPRQDAARVMLRANADSWVQVRDKAGNVLLNKVLRPGDTWPVPPVAGLLMTTGNAGGTDILVDGVVTASLGAAGSVRRDLPLDADQAKGGKLAPLAANLAPSNAAPANAAPMTGNAAPRPAQ